jgi:hypothetical protein
MYKINDMRGSPFLFFNSMYSPTAEHMPFYLFFTLLFAVFLVHYVPAQAFIIGPSGWWPARWFAVRSYIEGNVTPSHYDRVLKYIHVTRDCFYTRHRFSAMSANNSIATKLSR